MDARHYLSQARLLNNRIKSYENELEYINALALGPSGPYYGPDKIKGPPNLQAPFIRYLDKIFELEKIINDEIDKLIQLKQQISKVIAEINDPKLELILHERYINCRNWEDIAFDLAYSQVYLFKLHLKALQLVKVPQEYSKV